MYTAIAIVATQLRYGEMREFMVVINANLLKRVLCSKGLLVERTAVTKRTRETKTETAWGNMRGRMGVTFTISKKSQF